MMNKSGKIAITIALLITIGIVMAQKFGNSGSTAETSVRPGSTGSETPDAVEAMPLLLDLGEGKCIPCKLMEPILEELRTEYAARFKVILIDVGKDPTAWRKYEIRVIPTQIFFDAAGNELTRHEGFYSKEDILDKWKEMGIDVE